MLARRGQTDAATGSTALRECVSQSVRRYLLDMDQQASCTLYDMVLREVEAPLFAEVMRHFEGNQTRAAEELGINRATLRKKLKRYGLA